MKAENKTSMDKQPQVPELSEVVRMLLQRRKLRGIEFAEKVGLSPASVSKIVNGVSRPRQKTFSRMCSILCENPDEERMLVQAFAGTERLASEEAQALLDDDVIERQRATRYLEIKAQAIEFRRQVTEVLQKAGLSTREDYTDGTCATDILVELGGKRVAVECKVNIHRDFERVRASAGVLLEHFACDCVLVVVPFAEVAEGFPHWSQGRARVVPLSKVLDEVRSCS